MITQVKIPFVLGGYTYWAHSYQEALTNYMKDSGELPDEDSEPQITEDAEYEEIE